MKNTRARCIQVFSLILLCSGVLGLSSAFAAESEEMKGPPTTRKSVNSAAALRSLENAVNLLSRGEWDRASFEARLGASYDPTLADFPYIEALSLAALNAPRADILERLENSLASGLFWRTYSKNDALVLCARFYAETCRYSAALARIETVQKNISADADYVRILSLYGLSRNSEARSLVSASLDRWPFDSRFPRVFFLHETSNTPDETSRKIAALILSRLYLWQDEDRQLPILAVPFESDPAIRERNIKIYRGMGKNDSIPVPQTDPVATLYALEYGIIGEGQALVEIFSAEKTGISLSSLIRLCRLAGSADIRRDIASRLASYAGIIIDDANADGIIDSQVLYRLGRPVEAAFDRDQDGYADFTVSCDLGLPTTISLRKSNPVVTYDTYPFVRSVTDANREYTLKPLSLSWAPVEWVHQDLKLPGIDFFTIRTTGAETALTGHLLINSSSFYKETAEDRKGGEVRVSLDSGVPVSSESRENGRIYALTTYSRGFPAMTKTDRDGDLYFETTMLYSPAGVLISVLVDRNGNRKNEYRESYAADGSARYQWDSDENGIFEITYTVTAEKLEKTEWIRSDTGVTVTITAENGIPRTVRYGSLQIPVLKDPLEDVWWLRRIPSKSREIITLLRNYVNPDGSPVVSYSITVDGKRIHAVRTGGMLFAESVDE